MEGSQGRLLTLDEARKTALEVGPDWRESKNRMYVCRRCGQTALISTNNATIWACGPCSVVTHDASGHFIDRFNYQAALEGLQATV